MSEFKTKAQVNYGWGLSFNMTGKAPAIAKRIFSTYADALAYINDANDSAIEGLQLSVFNDADTKKNGIYFVEKIGTGTEDGVLKKVGDGSGVVSVADYNAAKEQATTENIGQLFYALDSVSEDGEVKYTAGLYVVTGEGTLSKLGTQAADGKDYQGQIDGLTARVSTVEGVVGNSEKGLVKDVADIKTAIGDAESGLTKKVADNTSAIKDIKTNLEAVNVKDIASDDKILSLAEDVISAKVSMSYGDSTSEGFNGKKTIKLLGKDSAILSEIDATDFIKDGMLEKVELKDFVQSETETKNGKYLVLTFNTESGKQGPIYLNVNELVDVYRAGKGLSVNDNEFSIKLKDDEKYLSLDADGNLVSKGIDDAISTAISPVSQKLTEVEGIANAANNKVKDLNFDDYAKIANLKTVNGQSLISDDATGDIKVIVGATIDGKDVTISDDNKLDLSSLLVPIDGDDVEVQNA